VTDQQASRWAMFIHLSVFLNFIVPIPFTNLLAPLILWQLKKGEHPLIDDQGKEAVNFQISILIYILISIVLILVLIGVVLIIAVLIFWFVMTIVAAIKANEGQYYRYPLTIRFIK